MSINFHAYQNKGYLLSVYEVVYQQWCEKFTGFDPRRAARILNLEYDKDYVYVVYYNQRFRLRRKDGVLEKEILEEGMSHVLKMNAKEGTGSSSDAVANRKSKKPLSSSYGAGAVGSAFAPSDMDLTVDALISEGCEAGWTEDVFFNEGMAIYHYLEDVKDEPGKSGVLIPNSSLDPRAVRKEDVLGKDFAEHFIGDCDGLEKACIALGGRKVNTKADVAYEFDAFAQIAVQVHFYDEDDDFPAQVQMMIDSQVTDYVHLECTGCFFSDIFERLIAQRNSFTN